MYNVKKFVKSRIEDTRERDIIINWLRDNCEGKPFTEETLACLIKDTGIKDISYEEGWRGEKFLRVGNGWSARFSIKMPSYRKDLAVQVDSQTGILYMNRELFRDKDNRNSLRSRATDEDFQKAEILLSELDRKAKEYLELVYQFDSFKGLCGDDKDELIKTTTVLIQPCDCSCDDC